MRGLRRSAQTVIEYMFMLAAVLMLVAITTNLILQSIKSTNRSVGDYVKRVRENVLENL